MALINTDAVFNALPAGGELIEYEKFRQAVVDSIGTIAPRSIMAARKQKMFTNELQAQADGTTILYVRKAIKGEARSQVTISADLAKQLNSGINDAVSKSKKVGG